MFSKYCMLFYDKSSKYREDKLQIWVTFSILLFIKYSSVKFLHIYIPLNRLI